jgi:hypothetical protein
VLLILFLRKICIRSNIEIVVGIENGGQYQAYKLQQIEKNKIINVEVNGKLIALISLYPSMVRAYDRILDAKKLDFEYISSSNKILDKQTGSEWNFDGLAINGQLKGKHLMRLPFDEGFWLEWVAFHPQTRLYSG